MKEKLKKAYEEGFQAGVKVSRKSVRDELWKKIERGGFTTEIADEGKEWYQKGVDAVLQAVQNAFNPLNNKE